jgi:hypothetical protein
LVEGTPAQLVQEPGEEPPAASPPAPAEDSTLTSDQIEELEEAEVAARLFPSRYGDFPTELKKWYEGFGARAKALLEKNPNLTEEDDEYQRLLNSKPTVKPADYKKVLKASVREDVRRDVAKELAPRFDQQAMDTRRAEILPAVQKFASETFPQGIRNLISADAQSPLSEALKRVEEKGFAAAAQEFPLECGVMAESYGRQQKRVEEFLLLKNRATPFNPRNAVHKEIADFISQEGRLFAQRGGKYLVQGARRFLPRDEFIAMITPGEAGYSAAEARAFNAADWTTSKFWTFTDAAIVDMMAIRGKEEAESNVATELKRAKQLGFERAARKPVAKDQTKPGEEPREIRPPRATPAQAPGAATTPPAQGNPDGSPIPVASIVSSLKRGR